MKRIVLPFAVLAVSALPVMGAQAFDIGGLVKNAVKDAITEVVEDTTKDATKSAVKGAAEAAGVEGADRYVDVAVDNAGGIQNGAANLKATSGMIGSSGIGGVSGALSAGAIAADKAKSLSSGEGALPRDEFQREYASISTKMGNCGADNKCIAKHQKQLIALQKRGDDYVDATGDANFNGALDSVDTRLQMDAPLRRRSRSTND